MLKAEVQRNVEECFLLFDEEGDWEFSPVTDLSSRHVGFLVRFPVVKRVLEFEG